MIDVPVRISARARRMQLVASAEKGVELVIPARRRISKRAIRTFLRTKQDWITHQQRRTRTQQQEEAALHARLQLQEEGMSKRAYINRARRVLAHETKELARIQGVEYDRITVRDQKSLWGSCSARRTLSYNWRLILLPEATRHYIIHHELAHLVWHGHGKRFWARVYRFCPEADEHRRFLRTHGRAYMSFLRDDAKSRSSTPSLSTIAERERA